MINSHLSSCQKFEIPEALARDHEELRTELIKVAIEPGPLGIAAKKVAHLYLPHFVQEEQMIFSAFALLNDLEAGRVRLDSAPVEPMIALSGAGHRKLRNSAKSIDSAVEEMLQLARQENNAEVIALVRRLRNHEMLEDRMMYPTVLMICRSVREQLQAKLLGEDLSRVRPSEAAPVSSAAA